MVLDLQNSLTPQILNNMVAQSAQSKILVSRTSKSHQLHIFKKNINTPID